MVSSKRHELTDRLYVEVTERLEALEKTLTAQGITSNGHPHTGLDHRVGHFRPLSITRQRHLVAYHGTARSHASLCQVFRQFLSPQPIVFPSLINVFLFQ